MSRDELGKTRQARRPWLAAARALKRQERRHEKQRQPGAQKHPQTDETPELFEARKINQHQRGERRHAGNVAEQNTRDRRAQASRGGLRVRALGTLFQKAHVEQHDTVDA